MDTGSDFIRPEFFNLLFVQQKNLVIFPYVDLKHLKALELFTEGFTVVDLDSTVLNDMKEIIEFEANNSYSQNKLFFFITNVGKKQLQQIMNLENVHCIINSNEDISELANGSRFVFFNKKHGQFLNFDIEEKELELEKQLITTYDDEALQEQVHQIKIIASKIYRELNNTGDLDKISEILKNYDGSQKYWNSVLTFTENYYEIVVPDLKDLKVKEKVTPKKVMKDFSNEYEILITTNKAIGKEFVQQLHEYRSRKVNNQHLELEELYNPLLLYNYLRNHHWNKGISKDFISSWVSMELSGYTLTELDQDDFNSILKKLNIPPYIFTQSIPQQELVDEGISQILESKVKIPSPHTNWDKFSAQLLSQLNNLDYFITRFQNGSSKKDTHSKSVSLPSCICSEISKLNQILEPYRLQTRKTQISLDFLKEEIISRSSLLDVNIWISNYEIKEKYEFVGALYTNWENLHTKLFGRSDKKMYDKINDFHLPQNFHTKLHFFRKFRNKVFHKIHDREKRNIILKENERKVKDIYLHSLAFLIKRYIIEFILKNNEINYTPSLKREIVDYFMNTYMNNGIFSQQEVGKIQQYLK
ncbi:MAG: hypothetical protein ACFFC3_12025 [Candidatus Odinarchaeota archaeon]